MTKIDKVLYTGKTRTTGGRDGFSRSADGQLDIKLSPPGSNRPGTNLFGDFLHLGEGASGKEKSCTVTGKGAGNRASDMSGRAVDHCSLVGEQHDRLPA